MAGTNRLPQLMKKLPQELFDNIYDLVFTPVIGARVNVVAGFRLPPQLSVSKAHRQQFAASYFRETIFVFTEGVYYDWITSLATANFDEITHIEIHDSCASADDLVQLQTPATAKLRRLKMFYDINMKEIFPKHFTRRIPSEPNEVMYFVGGRVCFAGGPLHGHWSYDHKTGSTKFTKVCDLDS